jgi:hypothetical protein
MDREQFIRVLRGCIESATGRDYSHIDWDRLTDRGLIESAELIRDLLEKRVRDQKPPELALGERMH